MNCFNIREIQTLLRSKYHPEVLSVMEHRQFLNDTIIGLRYKLTGLEVIDPSMLNLFNYGLLSKGTDREQSYFFDLDATSPQYFSNFAEI
jgi:hypothetical protein